MASLGFRHAQFSEDSAWLPDWLQMESPKEELLKRSGLCSEDREAGKDNGKVDDGDNRFHLYWSGEGSSQVSAAQPPGDVLHFHLYLSSYSNSPCRGSQNPSISKLLVHSLQNHESASEPVELDRARQCEGGVKVSNLEEDVPEPDEIDQAMQHEERVKVSTFKEAAVGPVEVDKGRQPEEEAEVAETREAEIYDAVELSIAASEAMIINELVEGDSDLGYLPMIAVVEMALRVKQARLEALKDMHHVPISGTGDDCSSSSELDDISIVDAFEDVGMSSNDDNDLGICDMDISHVQETPASKNYKDYDNGSESLLGNVGNVCPRNQSDVGVPVNNDNDLGMCDMDISRVQETPAKGYDNGPEFLLGNADNLCPRNQSDGDLAQARELTKRCSLELTKESSQNQDSVPIDFAPDSAISEMSTHVHKVPHVSVGSMSYVATEDKRSGSAVAGHKLDQPQCDVNLSYDSYQDQVRDRPKCTTSRFQSRWFGGWTAKEADAAEPIKRPTDRNIGKPFVGEMSSLSESADVAPDEMSVVQERQSRRSEIGSQSSIPLGGSCRKVDQGVPFSQEVARSSSQSSIDPLCSIVPCSLSAENPGSPQAQYRGDEYVDAEKCSSPTSGPRVVKLYETSEPEIQCNQKVHPSTANDERSEGIVQRQLSPLKNYSMLLPRRLNGLDNFSVLSPLECDRRTALSKMEMDTSRASVRSSVSSLRTRLKYSVVRDSEKSHGSGTAEPSDGVTTNRKSLDRFKGAAQVLPPLPTKRKSPGTLDRTKRCRIQVSSYLANDSFSKDKQPIELEAAVNIQESNMLHNIQGHGSNPTLDQPRREKRVRFAEAEVPRQVGRCRNKLKSSRKNGTQSRKRLGSCKQQLDPRGEGMQLLARCNSDRKKFIFQGMEFIVTGFSSYKEKEIEGLIQRHGGNVLLDIPPAKFRRKRNSKVLPRKPIVIASEKSRTAKFLYGCAVKTLVLEVSWLTDSISAGKIKSPEKYMIISYQPDFTSFGITGESFHLSNSKFIFEHVGIMLHGKSSFFTKFATIIKHGGGQAFRTLQQLLQSLETKKVSFGAIATEFESTTSRHLRQCAMERNIPVMPASWMIESLYAGKLLPLLV